MEFREGEIIDGCYFSQKSFVKGRGTERIDGWMGKQAQSGSGSRGKTETQERPMKTVKKKGEDTRKMV